MTAKQYLSLSFALLLLFHGQTVQGNVPHSHSDSLPDGVVGLFLVVPAIAYLLSEDPIQGKHNPNNDTLSGGKLYGAKWGALLGTFGVFICPSQLKNSVRLCQCTPDTAVGNCLTWITIGAALGAVAGYLRSSSLDQKYSLECAQELRELTPELQKSVNLAFELEATHSPKEKQNIFKKISALNSTHSYPTIDAYYKLSSIKIRFLRIETYLNRALQNAELDANEISLIDNLIQDTKKTISAIKKTLLFIGKHPAFRNQKKERETDRKREKKEEKEWDKMMS